MSFYFCFERIYRLVGEVRSSFFNFIFLEFRFFKVILLGLIVGVIFKGKIIEFECLGDVIFYNFFLGVRCLWGFFYF